MVSARVPAAAGADRIARTVTARRVSGGLCGGGHRAGGDAHAAVHAAVVVLADGRVRVGVVDVAHGVTLGFVEALGGWAVERAAPTVAKLLM